MITEHLKIEDIEKDRARIERAGALLREGRLVAIPTETVYGLGANALDAAAVAGIFRAKGRPQDNPLIVHIAALDALPSVSREVPETALALARAFWPGPLTMLLPKSAAIPAVVTAGLDTVGVRFPSHPVAQAVIRAAGVPVAAPSANLSGRPSPTEAAHVAADMDGRIEAIVDGGPCRVGVESTVVEFTEGGVRILRPGGVTFGALERALGRGRVQIDPNVNRAVSGPVRSPGMKYRHYAPKAPVLAVCGLPDATADKVAELARTSDEPCAVLCFDEYRARFSCPTLCYGPANDHEAQARRLFDALRRFDDMDIRRIYAQCPDDDGVGLAVANRLKRAAGFHLLKI